MNDGERDEFLIDKLVSYQLNLVSRRWQFFAVYVLINGILYNAIGKSVDIRYLNTSVALTGVFIALLLLQLVSITAERLEKIQIRLIQEHQFEILDIPLDGKFRVKSSTTLIYLSITSITLGWFIILFDENQLVFAILALIFTVNLLLLRWSPPANSPIAYEKLNSSVVDQ